MSVDWISSVNALKERFERGRQSWLLWLYGTCFTTRSCHLLGLPTVILTNMVLFETRPKEDNEENNALL